MSYQRKSPFIYKKLPHGGYEVHLDGTHIGYAWAGTSAQGWWYKSLDGKHWDAGWGSREAAARQLRDRLNEEAQRISNKACVNVMHNEVDCQTAGVEPCEGCKEEQAK